MKDHFFSAKFCDRCHKPLTDGRTMSMFNTDVLCMKCAEEETKRKDYAHARDVEAAHVRAGDMNFKGVGLSRRF